MARRKRHSAEDTVRKLRRADELSAAGSDVAEVCRQLGVSQATYYKRRKQYRDMSLDDVKELRELRAENTQLKKLVAEAELEKLALREIAKGQF